MLSHSGRHPLSRPHPQLHRHLAQTPFTRAQISPIGPRRSPLPAAGIKNGLSNYLDIMLPGLDGLSVLRRWRQQGDSTPVLLLSARGEISERVAGLDAGADDYLPKPFALV